MAKVFITQIPHRRDPETNAYVPTVNVSPAQEHGEIVVMMPPRAAFHATGDLVKQLRAHLEAYDFDAGDCLVAIGDPNVIAVASAVLGQLFGKFALLKWDRQLGRYIKSVILL